MERVMKGAREYSGLELEGLHGRLYIVQGSHARGKTLMVFVLPENIEFWDDGKPVLTNAVRVYDVVSGQRGWTEQYGWVKEGKWQADFELIVDTAKTKKAKELYQAKLAKDKSRASALDKCNSVLSSY